MKRAAWIALAAALPLAAQPKLPPGARLDTRSAAQGLDREFQALLTATPQPAWIGYAVPSTRTTSLGCEFVSQDGSSWSNGTVHLEPPAQALILFRVVADAVERIRTISPFCEIDPGDAPFHWIADVASAQSVALLSGFATQDRPIASAIAAIAVHGDPAAEQALARFATSPANSGLLRQRAIAQLVSRPEPEALALLISLAQTNPDSKLRAQAVRELGHSRDAKAANAIGAVLDKDADSSVQSAACAALRSLPDGLGIPRLIQLASQTSSHQLRNQAMALLRDSHDPRALAFFESILTK